jgi:phosphoribosyl 1,2-cyclic phosphodiesterase
MLELYFLGSGSRGNALVIGWGGRRLLIDCGFTSRELARRAERLGLALDSVAAVLITHEHRDHVCGLAGLAARAGLAVYTTERTGRALYWGRRPRAERLSVVPGRPFQVGPFAVTAFASSHDARDPVGYVLGLPDGSRLGLATDLGTPTPQAVEALRGCEWLALEANHDPTMLRDGPYPWVLKQRIRSDRGHLSNGQSADLLERVAGDRLHHVFALHLSQTNNTPALARTALSGRLTRLGAAAGLTVLEQDRPLRHPTAAQLSLW